MLASSRCQRPSAEASQAHNAYTLTSFGTCQGQIEAGQGPYPCTRESCLDRPPPGRSCPLMLVLQTLLQLPSLHGLPGQAGQPPAHTLPGPRAQDGQCLEPGWAQSICVCVCVRVMLPLLLPLPRAPHTQGRARTCWARDVALELLPELGLMQTFLCLLGRGTPEGPGSKPAGLRTPTRQGLAPGFRHTTTTRACAHACLVCPSHMHPLPGSRRPHHHHTHLMLYTQRSLTSLTPGVGTHLPHMLPFFHPPRDTRWLLPDPNP